MKVEAFLGKGGFLSSDKLGFLSGLSFVCCLCLMLDKLLSGEDDFLPSLFWSLILLGWSSLSLLIMVSVSDSLFLLSLSFFFFSFFLFMAALLLSSSPLEDLNPGLAPSDKLLLFSSDLITDFLLDSRLSS